MDALNWFQRSMHVGLTLYYYCGGYRCCVRFYQLNRNIKALGAEKVRVLEKIKTFRKSINFMQWEHTFMLKQLKNLEEYHTDLLLLRVEKRTLSIIRGASFSVARRLSTRLLSLVQTANTLYGTQANQMLHCTDCAQCMAMLHLQ